MRKRFQPRVRSVVGIDITPTAVKAVEIARQGQNAWIEAYAWEPLVSHDVETDLFMPSDKLTVVLKKLLAEMRSSTRQAILAVPDSAVISKTMQFADSLNELELEELVLQETHTLGDVHVDFVNLEPNGQSNGTQEVLLVAAKAEQVNKRVEIVKSAGFTVEIVDIESYAVARVVNQLLTYHDSIKIAAVVDIGYQCTRLYIIDNGKVIYTREETFGAKQLTHPNCNKLSFVEAYETVVLQPFVTLMALHINRNLQFFFADCQYEKIEHLYLAGEAPHLAKLASMLQNEIKIPTTLANPLAHLAVTKKVEAEKFSQLAPSFLIALGLALR